MNELEFLRSQLRRERTHYEQLQALLRRSLHVEVPTKLTDAVLHAAANYLVFALRRAVQRDHLHARQIESRLAAATDLTAEQRSAIRAALASLNSDNREADAAVAALAATISSQPTGDANVPVPSACRSFDDWARRFSPAGREALEPWFERLYDLGDWRRVALTDAESVLEERRLHAAATAAASAAGLLH